MATTYRKLNPGGKFGVPEPPPPLMPASVYLIYQDGVNNKADYALVLDDPNIQPTDIAWANIWYWLDATIPTPNQ